MVLSLMVMLVSSCDRFEDFTRLDQIDGEMEFKPAIVAPLAYGDFSLEDVLTSLDSSGLIGQYEDNLLYVYYKDTAYSVTADEMLDVPNKFSETTYIDDDIDPAAWALLPPNIVYSFPKIDTMDFTIEEGDKIDSIFLKGGNVNIEVSSEFKHSGTLTVTSPHICDSDGDTLVFPFTISETDGSYYSNRDYPADGYKIAVQNEGDRGYVRVNYTLALRKEDGVPINPDEVASIDMTFEEMDFSHIYGFVAEREVLDVNQTLDIALFDMVASLASIKFKNPEFALIVHNSYGLEAELDLSDVEARSGHDGSIIPLAFDDPNDTLFTILAPTIDMIGESITSIKYISGDNSNIEDILAEYPDQFNFNLSAKTGNAPGAGPQNFLLDTSKMDIELEVVLPMWLQAGDLTLQDTMEMDFEMLGDLNFIDSVKLSVRSENEFPVEARIQGYFLTDSTSNFQVIDSLFDDGSQPVIVAAQVDDEGDIIENLIEEELFEVKLTGDKMSDLADTRNFSFKVSITTTDFDEKFVKFYSHYELSYRLHMDAAFRINTSELDFEGDEY